MNINERQIFQKVQFRKPNGKELLSRERDVFEELFYEFCNSRKTIVAPEIEVLQNFIKKNHNAVTIQHFYVDTVEDMSFILDAINTIDMFLFVELNSNYKPVYFYGGEKANNVLTFILERENLKCNLKVTILYDGE